MITQQLVDYIRNELAQGRTPESVRANLIAQGIWSREDVDAAIQPFLTIPAQSSIAPHKNKTLSFIAVIGILLLIGLGAYAYVKHGLRNSNQVASETQNSSSSETVNTSSTSLLTDALNNAGNNSSTSTPASGSQQSSTTQDSTTVTQSSTTASTCVGNNDDYLITANSHSTTPVSFQPGEKGVLLGSFTIQACHDIYLDSISPVFTVKNTSDPNNTFFIIQDFTNLRAVVDRTNYPGTSRTLNMMFDFNSFSIKKGQIKNIAVYADIVSNPPAAPVSASIDVFTTVALPAASGGESIEAATNNLPKANQGALTINNITIQANLSTLNQCTPTNKSVIITTPSISTALSYAIGDTITVNWIPCNLPSDVTYKIFLFNSTLLEEKQAPILWQGTSTTATFTIKGPLDPEDNANAIEIIPYENGAEIQGNLDSPDHSSFEFTAK